VTEAPRVALLVPNLFLRIPLETAIRNAGAQAVAVPDTAQALAGGFAAVVLDLGAAGDDAPAAIAALVRAGAGVLAFAPHVESEKLAAARRAGAVALARSAFLARLPELLALVLKPGGGEGVPR